VRVEGAFIVSTDRDARFKRNQIIDVGYIVDLKKFLALQNTSAKGFGSGAVA
jgi:hypothetical protein